MRERAAGFGPAHFFVLVGLLVGVLDCIVIPYGAGFDEERHIVRIYYMSKFEFMPNFPDPVIHEDIFDLSYQRRLVQTPAFDLFSPEALNRRFTTFDQLRYGQKTQSLYSPVIFLPQALIGRWLWWKYDLPILPVIMLQRMAGLLVYLAGAYAAIRALPFGKWLLAVLALLPAALYQAATLNADGFNTAVSFAFIGWTLAVQAGEQDGVRTRSAWILAGLALLLGLAKPGAIVLLPLWLLLIRQRFTSPVGKLVLLSGAVLGVAANVGWWLVAAPGSVFAGSGVQSVGQQSGQILTDPLGFGWLVLQSLWLTFADQVRGLVAGFGYGAGVVPPPVYLFVALGLLAAWLAEPAPAPLSRGLRAGLPALGLLCSLAIYTVAFIPNYVTGGILALAKHGRYYIPFVPLIGLGLAGVVVLPAERQRLARQAAGTFVLLALAFFTFSLFTTYYTYCGYPAYMGGMCTLPVYKNLEKEDSPDLSLTDGVQLSQTFTKQCRQLELVQVYVSSLPQNPAGSLQFTLLDDRGQVIASRDFPAQAIAAADYLSLPIAPPAVNGPDLEIRLQAAGLAPPDGLVVKLTRTDFYPGQASVNGDLQRGDLLMRYTCTGP